MLWFERAFITLTLLVAAGLLFAMWRFDQPPFDLRLLDRLEPGMSKQQVREILGAPDHPTEGDTWSYSAFFAWPVVHVRFDAAGGLVSHEYDR